MDNRVTYATFQADTVENALAFLGGIYGLFFMAIQMFIGHYQEFSFQKSLVNNFYKNSKEVDGDDDSPEPSSFKFGSGEDPMNDSLLSRFSARPSQEIFYFDHL